MKDRFFLFFLGYNFFSIILFYFGPLKFPMVNVELTLIMLIVYNFSFISGFVFSQLAIRTSPRFRKFSLPKQKIIFILSAVIGLMVSFYYLSLPTIGILDSIILGLINPGEAYSNNIELEKTSGFITQLITLLSPLSFACIPLGVLIYKDLNKILKIILVVSVLFQVAVFVSKGTNFGIFLTGLSVIVPLLLNENKRRMNKKIYLFIMIPILYFLFTLSSRLGVEYIPNSISGITIDKENIVFEIFPNFISFPLTLAQSYTSQGYYALSLAPNYPFESTLGFGGGGFIQDKGLLFFDESVVNNTYQKKMDHVWNSRVQWHTAYVWFANDISLFGVPILMFIIGVAYSSVLRSAKEENSVVAKILLPLYVLMLLFIPANNILFSNPIIFMSFWVLNILWILSRKVYIKK